jgi:hypothetical protein
VCGKCKNPFDTFQTQAVCPYCATQFPVTKCLDCGGLHPMREWIAPAVVAPPAVTAWSSICHDSQPCTPVLTLWFGNLGNRIRATTSIPPMTLK